MCVQTPLPPSLQTLQYGSHGVVFECGVIILNRSPNFAIINIDLIIDLTNTIIIDLIITIIIIININNSINIIINIPTNIR